MSKTISIIRIAILLALGVSAAFLIFCEEQQSDFSEWLLQVLIDKTIGIAAASIAVGLYKRWIKTDPWLITYDRFFSEQTDNSNPLQF